MPRPFGLTAFTAAFCLALAGCNDAKPPTSEKKEEKKTEATVTPGSTPGTTPANTSAHTETPAPLPPAEKIDLNVGVGKDATDFLKSLRDGAVKADQLSAGLVKAIGLPVELPADKAKGYSPDAAEALLRRIGSQKSYSLPFLSKQVGDVALFRGTFVGEDGSYALRMIHEGNAWKVDWFSLTSAKIEGAAINNSSGDVACQEFAVAAIVGVLLDHSALAPNDRAHILAAGLTPALRKKWAEPFDSDKAQGLDYSPAGLARKAAELSTGVEGCSIAQPGASTDYRIELIRAGNAKTPATVKLVKGTTPGQWLVDDVAPQAAG
jgi:hypothetical protein